MSDTAQKTFEAEDIETVKDLQSKYATNTAQIGQVEVELHLIKKRLKELEDFRTDLFTVYETLQQQEKDLVKTLGDKYGDGVLDLDSGKFISSES